MTLVRALHPWNSEALKGKGDPGKRFISDRTPADGTVARLRVRHPTGDYTLPFICRWMEGRWANARTLRPVEVDVVGWHVAT